MHTRLLFFFTINEHHAQYSSSHFILFCHMSYYKCSINWPPPGMNHIGISSSSTIFYCLFQKFFQPLSYHALALCFVSFYMILHHPFLSRLSDSFSNSQASSFFPTYHLISTYIYMCVLVFIRENHSALQ